LQIKINLQIFVFAMVFILTGQIEIYAIIMFFALIHELFHMLSGILLGLKPKSLEIMPFGLSVVFEIYESKKDLNLKKIIIASSGPIANMIIAIVTYIINKDLSNIIYSNIIIAIFNLLPIYPLDGGRILKLILKNKYRYDKVEDITNKVSNATIILITCLSSVLVLLWQNIGLVFVITYLWLIMIKENKRSQLHKKIYNEIAKSKEKLYTNEE